MTKWTYSFGGDSAEGRANMKDLLGGKGANLAEMSALGLPVPTGFTITTEVCAHFIRTGGEFPGDLASQVNTAMARMEAAMNRSFGDRDNPLLVSIRSGAKVSMPGMMDTVLNLGLNDVTVQGLARVTSDPRFAYDSYRRFIQMYANVVLGIDSSLFEGALETLKENRGAAADTDLQAPDLQGLVEEYKVLVLDERGKPFPQDLNEQLWDAIAAVFRSWTNTRALTYRKLNNIPGDWGTAVNVQAMVFGNMGDDCATGVCFSRNPSSGDNHFYGEFLVNAQGEDVVAGTRTPQCLSVFEKEQSGSTLPALEELMPGVYARLHEFRGLLERHYRDMQDMEFTIERNTLWMLQTRSGKRTVKAAVKIAVQMVHEGLIDKGEALGRIQPEQLDQILHPMLDPQAPRTVVGKGLPASPGAAWGKIVFNAEAAVDAASQGQKTILVRTETSPEDIAGMHAAEGILTMRGGMTSHAAVVARGMGKPCVAGAEHLRVDYKAAALFVSGASLAEGDIITIDGGTGEVMVGKVPMIEPVADEEFHSLMAWADDIRRLGVRANAETLDDTRTALRFGAEGIGLCRTEHMFFDTERIIHIREMILAETAAERKAALEKLLPHQRRDFEGIFVLMDGMPVTVRLLDPPLHEFLPQTEKDIGDVAESMGVPVSRIAGLIEGLHEQNPMLGHRGCRLGVTYPEIYEMQARAIFEAAVATQRKGLDVLPEVMVPLVGMARELDKIAQLVRTVAAAVIEESGIGISYKIGAMVELPRAALRAGEIARQAEFLSFGTNDLTQTTLGISRDDAASFLARYQELGVLDFNPFATLDKTGVGELIEIAVERARKRRPDIKLGICGEHGGDPQSIRFCHDIGLDYVSCSPYRIPIARLAAAQAALDLDV